MKKVSFLIAMFLLITGTIDAQDIPSLLQNARTAFDNGNYRATVENVKKMEQAIGSTTKRKTVGKAKKICPKGWHLPTKNEYQELLTLPHKWTTRNGVKGNV